MGAKSKSTAQIQPLDHRDFVITRIFDAQREIIRAFEFKNNFGVRSKTLTL